MEISDDILDLALEKVIEQGKGEVAPVLSDLGYKKRAFLLAYMESGVLIDAANAVGIHPQTHYDWQKADPAYVSAFEVAKKAAANILEKEAWRRAREGVRKLRFDRKGQPLIDPETGKAYVEHEYSDLLTMFLLKGLLPETYRENQKVELTGKDGDTLTVKMEVDPDLYGK